jgi:hypothetical protein
MQLMFRFFLFAAATVKASPVDAQVSFLRDMQMALVSANVSTSSETVSGRNVAKNTFRMTIACKYLLTSSLYTP